MQREVRQDKTKLHHPVTACDRDEHSLAETSHTGPLSLPDILLEHDFRSGIDFSKKSTSDAEVTSEAETGTVEVKVFSVGWNEDSDEVKWSPPPAPPRNPLFSNEWCSLSWFDSNSATIAQNCSKFILKFSNGMFSLVSFSKTPAKFKIGIEK